MSILEIVIVRGIRMITVRILFKTAEMMKVMKHKIIINRTGFAPDNLINLIAKNWNNPASCEIKTIIIIAIIKISECKFTYPSSGVPNKRETIIEKSNLSRKIKTKYVIMAPKRAAIALFIFSETIRIITPIKHDKIIIILIGIIEYFFELIQIYYI